jgi:phosphoribosylformylglycinamidine synthase
MAARALILAGFGLNCDFETKYAFELAGARADRVHLSDLIAKRASLTDYDVIVFTGGFSWADDHGAGVLFAQRFRAHLGADILRFVEEGGLVIGICNGFQALVNLGLLPAVDRDYTKRDVALIANDCGNFQDRWVNLKVNAASPCVFTRDIDTVALPVRHGEGKLFAAPEMLERLAANGQVALTYCKGDGSPAQGEFPDNPNGSLDDIAGISDPTGRVFGLMPHPEAHLHFTNRPGWAKEKELLKRAGESLPKFGEGLKFFTNAVDYINRRKGA